MHAIAKICTVCGEDVSNKRRTKDSAGRYYCASCYADSQKVEPVAEAAEAFVKDDFVETVPYRETTEIIEPDNLQDDHIWPEPQASASTDSVSEGFDSNTAQAVSYPTPSSDQHGASGIVVPAYAGLRAAAIACRVLAAVNLVIGSLLLFFTLYAYFSSKGQASRPNPFSSADEVALVVILTPVISIMFVAFVFWVASHAIAAFRDIARNSWISAFERSR